MDKFFVALFVLSFNLINAQELDSIALDTLTDFEINFADSINLINQKNKILVESREAYNNGLENMKNNNFIKAISYFSDAILIDSTFSLAYFNRANCYYKLGNKDPIIDYQKSFYYDSLNYQALYQIASIQKERDINLAIKTYQTIIHLNKLESQAYYELGNLYYQSHLIAESIEAYTSSLSLSQDANILNDRAGCFRVLGEYNKAISDYLLAIKLEPELAFIYNNLASIYRKQNKLDDALYYYSLALQKDVEYVLAYNNRAGLYIDLGDLDNAMQDVQKSIEIDDNYAPAYNNRGVIYYNTKKYNLALVDFDRAIELNNLYAKAYLNRGICRQMIRDEDGACNDWYNAKELGVEIAKRYLNNDCQ